ETLVRRWVDADDEIIAIFDEIDLAILRDDLELDLWIGAREADTDPGKRHMRKNHRCADPQPAPRRGCAQDDSLPRFRDFRQQSMSALVERSPFFGQSQALGT